MTQVTLAISTTSNQTESVKVNLSSAHNIPDYLINELSGRFDWTSITWTTALRTHVIERDYYKKGEFAPATIRITGQISGNFTLNNTIASCGDVAESGQGSFNSFWLRFDTKRAAKEAIRLAYRRLVSEEPELKGSIGGIRKNSDNTVLFYDASQATITEE